MLINLKTVMKITTLSRSTIYHYIQLGKFPKQVRISNRKVAWYADDINEWVNNFK